MYIMFHHDFYSTLLAFLWWWNLFDSEFLKPWSILFDKNPESQVSVVARWTWAVLSWWAAHIKWQSWYLNGGVQLDWILMSVFSAKAHAAIILGKRAADTSIPPPLGDSSSQSSIKSSTFKVNLYPGLPVGCWSSQQSIIFFFKTWPELYVIVIGLIHRLGLTAGLLLLSSDENRHHGWCVIHLIHCSWFNLIKCTVWLSGSQDERIIHGAEVCYEGLGLVSCNTFWLWEAPSHFLNHKGGV